MFFDDQSAGPAAQTRIIENSLSPIWNESFFIPVPPRTERLSLFIYHKTGLGENFLGRGSDTLHYNDEKFDK